jgi:hypothetical protein
MLGATPSPGHVDTYFATAALVNTALWVLSPEWLGITSQATLTAVQLHTIHGNNHTIGACFTR